MVQGAVVPSTGLSGCACSAGLVLCLLFVIAIARWLLLNKLGDGRVEDLLSNNNNNNGFTRKWRMNSITKKNTQSFNVRNNFFRVGGGQPK
jgi:hypothetical protein